MLKKEDDFLKKVVRVGDLLIGGNNPITVQSMTTTDTRDINSTVLQIKRLQVTNG